MPFNILEKKRIVKVLIERKAITIQRQSRRRNNKTIGHSYLIVLLKPLFVFFLFSLNGNFSKNEKTSLILYTRSSQ